MLRSRCSARSLPLHRLSNSTGGLVHRTIHTPPLHILSPVRAATANRSRTIPTYSHSGAHRSLTSSSETPQKALRQLALSHHRHTERTEPAQSYSKSLRAHISVSLLPINQQCALSLPRQAGPLSPQSRVPRPPRSPEEEHEAEAVTSLEEVNGLGEPVIGVVSPIEGGDCYNREAVLQVAGEIGAEVVRIDLALGLGLSGPSGPLSVKGSPSIPDKLNPLLARGPDSHADKASQDVGEDMDFPDEMGPEGHFKIPVMTLGAFPGQASEPTPHSINDEWVAFFSSIINENDSNQPRILLLESCSTMSTTFSIWWPSFAEAVRSRRRKARASPGRRAKATVWDLVKPTSVVLSFAPSLLGSHTASVASADGHRGNGEEIWWGSEEHDAAGRQLGDRLRMEALRASKLDARQIIPSANPPADTNSNHTNPILAALASKFSSQSSDDRAEQTLLWQAIPIVPPARRAQLEADTRRVWRQAVSVGLVARALVQLQSTLTDTDVDPETWANRSMAWPEAQALAVQALGCANVDQTTFSLHDVQAVQAAGAKDSQHIMDHLQTLLPTPKSASQTDPVISALKKATDLNKYEKRLLPCVVDAHKLASTNFSRVHLPDTTIDAIRTMVSLPLLYPEAFRTGILGEHSSGGALLFGPPGTGKTLLARAVASESGARMLAIQPSDVNDMYVGEGEKLVRAVFSLARRLSPCVVFIDEVDSLFGARSAKDSSGSGRSHNQLLTEFMQEMDGLNSAITNREQRVVVVGATNRPFDLDEAVLRRLPRRLLIDLPRQEDRKAILSILLHGESLAADVDLDKLASRTDGFSGSDLKHLCVAAALASLKDTVKLPWLSSTPHRSGSIPQSSLPGATHAQPVSTEEVNEPDRKHVIEAGTPLRLGSWRLATITRAKSPSPRVAGLHTDTKSIPGASETQIDDYPPVTRELSWKHFETALLEISPSSTEDGTLPELRKWAEQFGDGGSKRSLRKGFGKGFGFSILGRTPSGGYGRVKAEELDESKTDGLGRL